MDIALSSDFRLLVHHVGSRSRTSSAASRCRASVTTSTASSVASCRSSASTRRCCRRARTPSRTPPRRSRPSSSTRSSAPSRATSRSTSGARHGGRRGPGHYEYEVRGQTRIPVMEEVVEYDEEGNKSSWRSHKLLIPDSSVPDARPSRRGDRAPVPSDPPPDGCPDLRSSADGRRGLRHRGRDEEYNEELAKKTVAQQEAKMKTYKILHEKNLPDPARPQGRGRVGGPRTSRIPTPR
jgi:hypothetical protein